MQQVLSIWVRDPRRQKNDFWHAYVDYEICLHVSRASQKKGKRFLLHPSHNPSPLSDDQRVFHQEDLMREEEVQRVCVAQTEAPSKLHPNVGRVNICFQITSVKNETNPLFPGCIFTFFPLFLPQGKTSKPASEESFLQPEQRAADRRENEGPPEVPGTVSNSPVDQ